MNDELQARVVRKLTWRILPFVMLLYFVSFLDRVNVGFAAITMNKDLGLTPTMFGLGGGIFFLGYFLFEVPSNLILNKVGARIWIARVMVTWGLVSAASAFVAGPTSFYTLRFLLGVAEAGFFPGIILYLSQWFPARQRAFVDGDRLAHFRRDHADARPVRLEGLAVAFHRRGDSRRPARLCGTEGADRFPGQSQLARRR